MYAKKMFLAMVLLATTVSQVASAVGDSPKKDSKKNDFTHCARTPAVQFNGTITEAAVATDSLSTLVTALQLANLDSALAQPGHFTVFAPTNDAFAAIPEPVLTTLLNNTDVLSKVLLYHVSETQKDPRRRTHPRSVKTLAGQPVIFNRFDGSPKINQSTVSCTPVKASNGTVYVIDSVLLPQF